MNTASRPHIHAAAAPSDAVVPKSASERAALAVTVTGLIFANACSQSGKVKTGTNTELAKTSGKITTNPADRLDGGEDQQVWLADEVTQVAAGDHGDVGDGRA